MLLAFKTSGIDLEARAREHATMFAHEVKVRTALRTTPTAGVVAGVAATTIGLGGGLAMVWWTTLRRFASTLPDFSAPDFSLPVLLRPETVADTLRFVE